MPEAAIKTGVAIPQFLYNRKVCQQYKKFSRQDHDAKVRNIVVRVKSKLDFP